jgi:outer membrane protein assembly factor BamB
LGSEGDLFCLDAATGAVVWSKNFPKEYDAKTSLWGYAGSPLVDGQKLLCVVGGPGSHVVAFDLNSGEEIWKNLTSTDQGYSPPIIIEAGGVRQLLLARPDAITSVNPETGQEYWSQPYQATNGSIIMSPVAMGDYLFVGGYDKQSLVLKLSQTEPASEIEWGNKAGSGFSPLNVQPVVVGEVMYGVDGNGELMAIELPSGERLWHTAAPISERPANSGTAFLVRQDDRFWLWNDSGELIIARLTPEGYEELDRTKLLEPTNNAFGRDVLWCAPAFANGRMIVRNDSECIAVDLTKR